MKLTAHQKYEIYALIANNTFPHHRKTQTNPIDHIINQIEKVLNSESIEMCAK